ncbi:HNH endonuclease [Rhodovulum marinum]|uniref:Putative HNH nuclease YajD n=1 Tax=Rhodovulum marinum TaxID=320662 RepID=A0A4R2PWZ7_9RHOB|nr:HNH endonuclease [Rhodovulum marinum]
MRKEHNRYSRHITRGPRWRTLRMAILERDGFRCRACGARGRLEVDHVKPVRTHPELAYDPANLQALCPACHTRKTRIECGHPEPDPRRKAWGEAVSALEARGTNRAPRKDKKCLIL